MRGWIRALAAFAFLAPAAAWAADVAPARANLSGGCVVFTMCNAQAATGVCTSAGSNIVADLSGFYTHSFYTTQGVGAYSCDVYSNDTGYDATYRQKLNTTALTSSGSVLSIEGLLRKVWLECSAVGTQATVTLTSCPIAR